MVKETGGTRFVPPITVAGYLAGLLFLDEPAVEIVLVQEVVSLHRQLPQRAVELVHIAIEQTTVALPGIQEIADALRGARGNLEVPVLGLFNLISLDYTYRSTPSG